ncbi:MAG: TonB family protein [Gammaproteobacteria bacterium]|nr:TonB family protein [Gammaproteobacteria bacterium]
MAIAMGPARRNPAPRPGVALAVGASLALHAAVLALLPAGPAPLPGNSASPALRVELARPAPRPAAAPAPVAEKPEPTPRISVPDPPRPAASSRAEAASRMPEPKAARPPETRPETVAARRAAAPARARPSAPPPQADTRASEAKPAAAPAPARVVTGPLAPGTEAGLAAEVRRVIRLRLAGEFRYPALARRRGWEGEVVLAFRVDADGRIGNVRVANSSGFGLLDSAARDALLRVAAVELADGRRPGAALDLTLPVIYRLSEG